MKTRQKRKGDHGLGDHETEELKEDRMLANVTLPSHRSPVPNSLNLSRWDTSSGKGSSATGAHRMAPNGWRKETAEVVDKPQMCRNGSISTNPEIGMKGEKRVTSEKIASK